MLIDTHAHVNFVAFKDDGDEVTKRALKENIWMINVGSQFDTSRRAVEYAQKYPEGVFASVGLHPIHLIEKKFEDKAEGIEFKTQPEFFDYEKYKILAKDKKVVAIGEVGLDYFHINPKSLPAIGKPKALRAGEYQNPKSRFHRGSSTESGQIQNSKSQILNLEYLKGLQREALLQQMALAQELNKPIIFHCREAHNDLLEILRNPLTPLSKGGARGLNSKGMVGGLKGVIHSFSGRWSQAQQYLEMGFYLGFNGIITFARDYDRVVKEMPLDRLLLETDCPYLTPEPHRGKRNEPSYVKYVAQKVAELRGISYDEVAEATTASARRLFNI